MKIISWVLLIFGCLLLISLFSMSMGSRNDYFYMFSIALSFIVLGGLGLEYVRRQYRGGAPTIIGAFFGLLGLQFMALAMEQYLRGLDAELVRGGALASVAFLVPGIILLRYGHKAHNKAN
jgi:hypothetical protein